MSKCLTMVVVVVSCIAGIIDILQQYNAFKRTETFFKSFKYDPKQISAVDPKWYAQRFVNFVDEHSC